MNLIEQSFQQLYPEKSLDYNTKLVYSGKFKPYNANAQRTPTTITIKLSKEWKKISKDIQIGIIQILLTKVFKKSKQTFNTNLYSNFIKNIHLAIPKNKSDPILEDSFNRLNELYFNNLIEKPNLKWGKNSIRRLGSYNYQTDEITLSLILKNNAHLMDYVMYHEILHKKHKFYQTKTEKVTIILRSLEKMKKYSKIILN